MGLINYNSPDYQRLVQRTMSSPLVQTNPSMQRKLMTQHTRNVMQQRVKLNSSLAAKARMENETQYQNKMMGFNERGMGLREQEMGLRGQAQDLRFQGERTDDAFRLAGLDLRNKELKWKESDLNTQTWLGLLPMGYSLYEGDRRAKQTDALTKAQTDFYKNNTQEPQLKVWGLPKNGAY